jgi:hypothetical protein
MEVIAICKTFRGHEFVQAMLDSVLPHVSGVILLHSELGWNGECGNTVKAAVEKYFEKRTDWGPADYLSKIYEENFDCPDQDLQYLKALEIAAARYPQAVLYLIVDTDEVWRHMDLTQLLRYAEEHPADAYCCEINTYLKSPFYQVFPPEPCRPTVLVRPGVAMSGPRGSKIINKLFIPGVKMDHFTGVRNSLGDVIGKVTSSTQTDGEPMRGTRDWVEDVWNALPSGFDLHWVNQARTAWKRVKQVGISDLPPDVQGLPIVCAWELYHAAQPKRVPSVELVEPPKKKRPPFDRHDGSLLIATMVDEKYAAYIPLFAHYATLQPIAQKIKVAVSGKYPDELRAITPPGIEIVELPVILTGLQAASMRLLYDWDEGQDYTYIADIDMMMRKEEYSIVDQHATHLERDRTRFYENWIIDDRQGEFFKYGDKQLSCHVRMAAIHFVNKAWWKITKEARDMEIMRITMHPEFLLQYGHDEWTLGDVVVMSGLTLPPHGVSKLWRNHGTHLGTVRHCAKAKQAWGSMSAEDSILLADMMRDKELQRMMEICGKYNQDILTIKKYLPTLFR